MRSTTLIGALVVGAIISSPLMLGSPVNAQTAIIPPWVIKSGGNVLGFFISDLGGDIVFGVKDGTIKAPVQIRKGAAGIYLEGNEPRLFYTGAGCSGTPYVNDHLSTAVKARTALLGATYAVGQQPGNPAVLQLFKGTGSAVGDPGIQSTFINGSCGTNVFGTTFREATAILSFPFGTPIPGGAITME